MINLYRKHIFPYLLDKASRKLNTDRKRLLPCLKGDVLELGVGTGVNFSFYSQGINSLIAIEPDATLLQHAVKQKMLLDVQQAGKFHLVQGDGHELPLASSSLDTVLCCLVLCSIPDPGRALSEIYRVLKPGGHLVLFEHVKSSHALTYAFQQVLNPVWRPLACGCCLQRDTFGLINQAGFLTGDVQTYRHKSLPALVGTMLEGVATKP
jgi:ubiquinone/menaquinone biosynthesis C-methylase UbiE